jgi:DNA-binding transcriptional regulator YiaG
MKEWTREEIRDFRKRVGLTLKEMGEITGVETNTVYRWEAGIIIPSRTAKILLSKLEKESKYKKGGGEKRHGKRNL